MTRGFLEEKKEQGREQEKTGTHPIILYFCINGKIPLRNGPALDDKQHLFIRLKMVTSSSLCQKTNKNVQPMCLTSQKRICNRLLSWWENGLYKIVTLCRFWIEFQGLLFQSKMHLNQQAGKTTFTFARLFLRWYPCSVKTLDDKLVLKQPGIRTGDHYFPLKVYLQVKCWQIYLLSAISLAEVRILINSLSCKWLARVWEFWQLMNYVGAQQYITSHYAFLLSR